MIAEDAVHAVDAARWGERFVRPLYDTYGFARIPDLIRALFQPGAPTPLERALLGPLADEYEQVVLYFVDAFGWRFLMQYQDRYPFLRRIVREGVVTKLTSQFPSTTTAHVTTIHTGLPPGRSGLYEWFQYEPSLDAVIAPLLFSFAGQRERNTLAAAGLAPERLFPTTTLYQELARQGVTSYVFQSRDILPSPFSNVVCDGARLLPYADLPRALAALAELVLAGKQRAYYHLYFDGVDAAGHFSGPDSPRFAAAVDACFTSLESIFHALVAGRLKRTLFLLTADHGLVAADPPRAIYLNRIVPEIRGWLQTNRRGQPLVPAGSARDFFLHLREEHLAEAHETLRARLAGRAEVHRVRDLIAAGFFGPAEPSPVFLSRVGDLVVLPYRDEAIWWYEEGRFKQGYHGLHGGLTPEEMHTALLALAYD